MFVVSIDRYMKVETSVHTVTEGTGLVITMGLINNHDYLFNVLMTVRHLVENFKMTLINIFGLLSIFG